MKLKKAISWTLAAICILTLLILPFLVTAEAYANNSNIQATGRFHILLLHFPIALLLLVPVFEIAGVIRRWRHLRTAVPALLVLCAAFSVVTCILGILLAAGEGIEGFLVQSHMIAGFLMTALICVLAVMRSVYWEHPSIRKSAAYAIILITSIAALVVGSHQGASMVHGDDYLVKHLPVDVKNLLGIVPNETESITFDSIAYSAVIVPILSENCYSCHDNSLTKGGFRMDTHTHLTAGGKSGEPAISPGSAEASELFTRITLNRDDEKAMPPIEENPLDPDDILLIKWWIDNGADPERSIGELYDGHLPMDVEKIIDGILQTESNTEPLDWQRLETVATASKASFGMDVIPYTQDPGDGVYVVARNASKKIGPEALMGLHEIAPHVQSINLWNQTLKGDTFSNIGIFTNLKELHLNQTNIANDDLRDLASLRRLRTLNLHGTGIDDKAISILSAMKQLRKLYLTNSQVSPAGVESLKTALPHCEIFWQDPVIDLIETTAPIDIASSSFKAVPNWGLKDVKKHDHGIGSTHGGIAIDKSGTIYVSSKTGIHLYNAKGDPLSSYVGEDYSDIHSLTIVEEDETEYIYAARNRDAEALKMTIDGEIVLRLPFPSESKVEGKFMPTAVIPIQGEGILLTDGYGSNKIFRFDASGSFISTFGGKDIEDIEKFNTPHGIALDTRYDPVRLIVSDREKRRLVHFDLEGNFIGEVVTDLRRPCAVSIFGEYVAVAELEGRVLILNDDNEIIHKLGDNPNSEQWANFKVAPDNWHNGIHTAPHGLAWDTEGNLYIQDWNSHGRITKWQRIVKGSSY